MTNYAGFEIGDQIQTGKFRGAKVHAIYPSQKTITLDEDGNIWVLYFWEFLRDVREAVAR